MFSLKRGGEGTCTTKQNEYLDKTNEEFFKPRGLFALVVKYKIKADAPLEEEIDIESNITQQVSLRDNPERSKWKNVFTSSSVTTTQESQIPECAPLVFPNVDRMDNEEKANA